MTSRTRRCLRGLGLAGALSPLATLGAAQAADDESASGLDGVRFQAISAVSGHDVWAAGSAYDGGPVVAHFDGRRWTRVQDAPPVGRFIKLNGVSALADDDVWAVGSYGPPDGSVGVPWSEHWDGASWSEVPVADPHARGASQLLSVEAISPADVWAVGAGDDTLIEHWNGEAWMIVDSPTMSGLLTSVSGSRANDVWAVGKDGGVNAISEHWDGTTWTEIDVPHKPAHSPLAGVYVDPSGTAWAVGDHGKSGHVKTYLLQWNGQVWQAQAHPHSRDVRGGSSPHRSQVRQVLTSGRLATTRAAACSSRRSSTTTARAGVSSNPRRMDTIAC